MFTKQSTQNETECSQAQKQNALIVHKAQNKNVLNVKLNHKHKTKCKLNIM